MFWGSNAVVARGLLNELSPATLAFLRWGIALAALAPFVWHERHAMISVLKRHPKIMLCLGATGFAPNALLSYFGLRGSTAILMGLMNSVVPVMVLLIVALWAKRLPKRLEAIGMTLSFLGVIGILIRGDVHVLVNLHLSGFDLLVLLGLIVWAFYTVILIERPRDLTLPGFTFLAGILGFIMILPFVIFDWAGNGIPHLSAHQFGLAFYIALAPTLLSMLLFNFAVAVVGPVQSGIFTHLVPLFSAVFATVFIHESLHVYHVVGFVLIVSGAILCCFKREASMVYRPPQKPTP
jgi:drug/metabolite transporter (DMT)-like permease